MRWLEATVTTAPESGEAVAWKLLDLGAGGVAIEEAWDYEQARRDGLGDIFPAAGGQPEDTVTIRGYFPLCFLEPGLAELKSFLGQLPAFGLPGADLHCRQVEDTAWEGAWKDYWRPTPAGQKLLVVPSWLEAPPTHRQVLRLDPGAAFGTGTHESTRLCLELLESYICGAETVLDLGCGSGILSLAARLLGAGQVTGIDSSEVAVRTSRDNAALNNLDVTFIRADLREDSLCRQLAPADLVLANLTADLLIELSCRFPRLLKSSGRAVVSGIVKDRAAEVIRAMAKANLTLVEEKRSGEWVALSLVPEVR